MAVELTAISRKSPARPRENCQLACRAWSREWASGGERILLLPEQLLALPARDDPGAEPTDGAEDGDAEHR